MFQVKLGVVKKLLIAFCFIFSSSFSLSQSHAGGNEPALDLSIVSPSPTVSSFLRHGLVPVNLSTGMPNIKLPIYEIQEGALRFPIDLTYSYSGLRPQDEASWVGLGWHLSAGGVINIGVKGSKDGTRTGSGTNYDDHAPINNLANQSYLQSVLENESYDAEPDIYSFSFAGYSGKFLFYHGKAITVPFQKLSISKFENGSDLTIRIIAADGVTYWFRDLEQITSLNAGGLRAKGSTTKSLMLSEIISADKKNTLHFTYNSVRVIANTSGNTETITKIINGPPHFNGSENFQIKQTELRGAITAGKQLSSIEGETVKVVFTPYPDTRRDLGSYGNLSSTAAALKEIKVYSKSALSGEKLISGYRLNVGYFAEGVSTNPFELRLKLTSLDLLDRLNNPVNTHQFEYEENEYFPQKNTKAIDHWGFYNGAVNNNSLIPAYQSILSIGNAVSVSNRGPVAGSAMLGALKKLRYPTGGFTTFQYEGNTMSVSQAGGLLPAQYNQEVFVSDPGATSEGGGTYLKTGVFTIPYPQSVSVDWHIDFSTACNPAAERIASPRIVIIKNADGEVVFESYRPQNSCEPDFESQLYLRAGTYQLESRCGITSSASQVAVAWLTMAPNTTPASTDVGAPGIRIKEISSYTDNNLIAGTKLYLYSSPGGSSSGFVFGSDCYSANEHMEDQPKDDGGDGCSIRTVQYQSITASPGSPYNGYIDQAITYGFVREVEKASQLELVTDHFFDNTNSDIYPDLLTGISEIRKVQYKSATGALTPISTETFSYDTYVDASYIGVIPLLQHKKLPLTSCQLGQIYSCTDPSSNASEANRCNWYVAETYFIPASWKYLASKQERILGNNGIWLEKKYSYEYDPTVKMLSKEIVELSDAKQLTTRYKYPENYSSNITGNLLLAGITAPIIEEQQWIKTGTVEKMYSGKITEIDPTTFRPAKDYHFYSPQPVTQLNGESKDVAGKFVSLISDAKYQERIRREYSAQGRLKDQRKTDDVNTSYIWGYNATYPIAQAANASNAEIFHDSFEEGGTWNGVVYDNAKAHAGRYSARIDNASASEVVHHSAQWLDITLAATKKFKYSGWIYSTGSSADIYLFMQQAGGTGYNVSYVRTTETNKWVYVEGVCDVPANITRLNIRIDHNGDGAGTVWFDDIRLHPAAAQMTTYTYDPLIGMTSQSDVNNRIVYYEYDGIGRLSLVRDESKNILKKYCYNYAGQQESCGPNVSAQWLTTSVVRCVQISGQNNGYQQREEKDVNPASPTYNQPRWVDNGYNPGVCPVPPSCSHIDCAAQGQGYQCINGQCEQGYRVNTNSYYNSSMGQYECTYHYEFSDGTWSQNYTEYNSNGCLL